MLFLDRYDSKFDPAHPAAQEFLVDACNEIRLNAELVQQAEGASRCVMRTFKQWITVDQGLHFPVPPHTFPQYMQTFLASYPETFHEDVGLEDKGTNEAKVMWLRASFFSHIASFSAGFEALPEFNQWEKATKALNKRASEAKETSGYGLDTCWQSSELWIRMFTEVSAVNGTLYV